MVIPNNFLFTLIFLGIANWGTVIYFLFHLIKPKQKLTTINDKRFISNVKNKTGLDVVIKIMDIDQMIGFMISSPPFPAVMVFSRKLFDSFNRDEKEWVILHESSHYFMWHSLKFALSQFTLLIVGIFIINNFVVNEGIVLTLLIGLLLGLLYVQIAKIFEYEADNFAAKNMDDPKGMVTGNIKMRNDYNGFWQNKIFKNFFSIAVSYEDRIKMAEKQSGLKRK